MSSAISFRNKQDIDKFIKFLCIKSTQIIVQGRIGKPISTVYSPSFCGSEWFNLSIKDYPDIDKEAKSAIQEGNPNINHSFVIEISVKTSDAEALVLEVWSIDFIKKCIDVHIRQEVYNRIALLLKSLVCVTRIIPAFKLSRRQGNEFVICYRVYMGPISLSGLGEGFKTLRVGSVGTPIGTYTLSAAYRTVDNLHVSQQQISPEAIMPFELCDDYFGVTKAGSSAKPCCTLQSRLRTYSETSESQPPCPTEIMLSSPSYNLFNASLSQSPMKIGETKEEEKASFTVGTPPSGFICSRKSNSSPILAKEGRRCGNATSPLSECSPSYKHGQHRSNCFKRHSSSYKYPNKRDSFSLAKGSSAPALPVRFSIFGTSPETVMDRPGGESSVDGVKQTTYRHWSNSNVTKITAGRNVIQAGTRLSHIGTKTNWNSGLNILTASPPPVYKTGAFVKASPDEGSADGGRSSPLFDSSLPFSEFLNTNNDENSFEEASHRSSSVDSLASEDRLINSIDQKRQSLISHSSSSFLSSKPSSESLKQENDDFVLVNLKPAFARVDSIEDLPTFYQEFKQAPELAMFEENCGLETPETLLELSKELDDYVKDANGFDEFITKMSSD